MDIKEIKNGDSFLVNGDTFLSRTICKVMKHWGKKKGYNTTILYSHAARFCWIADELYLFGSVDNGYQPIKFRLHYDWNKDDFAIMRRKTELSATEEKQTINYCLHLDTVSVGYQYWNFIQWLLLAYVGINTFKKGTNDSFNYCYESERKCRKDLNPENYGDVSQTDIFDLLYDPNYTILYRSKK
jgi:hypothetical protein